jgi:hypothetical protein
MQTLVRSMPDLHKTLILANARRNPDKRCEWEVDELAMATEHAPFRHRNKITAETKVGTQHKKQKTESKESATATMTTTHESVP